jgi:hypothetical protein
MSKKASTAAVTAMARTENEATLGASGTVHGLMYTSALHT